MIQIMLAAIVAIWLFKAAARVNLDQGKWVFVGLISYLIPSVLWTAVFVSFLRKPVLESLWQNGNDSVTLVVGILTGAVGPALGIVSAYALTRKYLTQQVREAAVTFEQKFITKVIYSLGLLLLSALVLYLAAKYAPEVKLESRFDYELF